MAATYTPIATTTLVSAQNTVTLSSIPSIYTDLIFIVNGTGSAAGAAYLYFNNDTATNYSATYLYGSGTAASSGRTTSDTRIYTCDFTTTQSQIISQIMNYSNTTTYKTVVNRGGGAGLDTVATVGLWRSTAAIDRIDIFLASSATFAIGSTFTLYGIKAA
jgi:hypothetical protein